MRREWLLPRFDETIANFVGDEAGLVDLVKGNWVLVSHVRTALNAETSAYAEELISILRSLTWDPRVEERHRLDGAEEIGLRRRIRELLVLLKGNDVWVYGDSNMKALPESYEVRPAGDQCDYEFQAIVAFGPPGEYGETSDPRAGRPRPAAHIDVVRLRLKERQNDDRHGIRLANLNSGWDGSFGLDRETNSGSAGSRAGGGGRGVASVKRIERNDANALRNAELVDLQGN